MRTYKKYKPKYPNKLKQLRTNIEALKIGYSNKMYEYFNNEEKFQYYQKELKKIEEYEKLLDAKGISRSNYLYSILNHN